MHCVDGRYEPLHLPKREPHDRAVTFGIASTSAHLPLVPSIRDPSTPLSRPPHSFRYFTTSGAARNMLRSAFRSMLPRTNVLPKPSTSILARSFYRTARPQTFFHRPPHLQIPTQTRLFSSTPRFQAQYVKFGGKPDSKWDITKLNSRYGVLFVIMGVGGLYYVTQ